jgi:hypothetical protein
LLTRPNLLALAAKCIRGDIQLEAGETEYLHRIFSLSTDPRHGQRRPQQP